MLSSRVILFLSYLLSLNGEGLEGFNDDAGIIAIVDVNRRTAHPVLQIVHGQRDVLREVLVEHLSDEVYDRHAL